MVMHRGAYQESTGNQDNDAAFAGGLGVKGGDLVTDLLEGKALLVGIVISIPMCLDVAIGGEHTPSFSTIAAVPWTELVSKVSIDWSRCSDSQLPSVSKSNVTFSRGLVGTGVRSYVERGETTAVLVEGLVVEPNELFCRMEGHGSEAWFLIEGHSRRDIAGLFLCGRIRDRGRGITYERWRRSLK